MNDLCRRNPWLSWVITIILTVISYTFFETWWISLLVFFFVLGTLTPDENETKQENKNKHIEKEAPISEYNARDMIDKLYIGTKQSFNNVEFPNIYRIDSFYKNQILKIISEATSGNVLYEGETSMSQVFSNGAYKMSVHGAIYHGYINARICHIYYAGTELLTIVWGDDTIEKYKNHQGNYTISPVHGLT